jgi:hypothetical protein
MRGIDGTFLFGATLNVGGLSLDPSRSEEILNDLQPPQQVAGDIISGTVVCVPMLERRQDSSTRPSNPSRSEEILNDLHGNKLLMLSFLALSFAYQCLNTNSSLPPPLLRLFVSLSPLLVMSGTLSHEINFYMGKDEECECGTIRV